MKAIGWGWLALGGGIIAYLVATSAKAQAGAGLSLGGPSAGTLPTAVRTAPSTTYAPAPAPVPTTSAADQAAQQAAEQSFLQGLSGSATPFPTGV